MTLETIDVVGSAVPTPFGVSGFVDNLVFLRFAESRGQVKRLLSLTKLRDTHASHGVHELVIDATGMRIAQLYTSQGDVIPTAEPVAGRAASPSLGGDTGR
jgi:circadian clock protein KaiC